MARVDAGGAVVVGLVQSLRRTPWRILNGFLGRGSLCPTLKLNRCGCATASVVGGAAGPVVGPSGIGHMAGSAGSRFL
jgi:hypothetical protein